MRNGQWWATVLIPVALGGCGIPKTQYYKQVARANRLEIHLKKKLDRVDFLEAKEKAARSQTRRARAGVCKRSSLYDGGLLGCRDHRRRSNLARRGGSYSFAKRQKELKRAQKKKEKAEEKKAG